MTDVTPPPYALVVGEALIDVLVSGDGAQEWPGGSAANVAVALARLGRPVRLLSAWGDDERGRVLSAHLAGAGVEMAADPRVLARTSTAAATLAADGGASYEFDLDWRLPDVGPLAPAFVHVCSLGAVLAPGSEQVVALVEALGAQARVTYDVNARPSITGTGAELVARVEAVARLAHLVKASDEDLAAVYPHLSADRAAEHLRTLGPRAVVVTRGADGLTWYGDGRPVEVPAHTAARVVDTIGAGDTVAAALIDALWDDAGPREALEHAARAAAVSVSRPGADPPTRAELAQRPGPRLG